MFAFIAGFAAGLLHVFSGPDHLAAIAPLAADGDRRQWKTGLQWGIGHTTGVLLIAFLLLLLREQLPLDAISAHSERLVGVLLIGVGVWGIRGAWVRKRSGAGLRTPDHSHSHTVPHEGAPDAGREGRPYGLTSFVMGAVHGLAGSSHLFGVLPALAMPGRTASALYLTGFGMGAIAGMTAFAAAMGMAADRFGGRSSRGYSGLLYASSAAALVVGGVWLVGQ